MLNYILFNTFFAKNMYKLTGNLIFLTYEFKIMFELASYNYFDKLLLENRHHFLRMEIPENAVESVSLLRSGTTL